VWAGTLGDYNSPWPGDARKEQMMAPLKWVVTAIAAVLLIMYATDSVSSQGRNVMVAIDLQSSMVPGIGGIDSIYVGDSGRVYAFLVIDGMPGSYISGYDVAFDLDSPDSSVRNLGFHRLPGWAGLDPGLIGFPSDLRLPGCPTPAAIGFWELQLVKGASSRGILHLGRAVGAIKHTIVLLDRGGQSVEPEEVHSAYVNPLGPAPGDSPRAGGEFVRLDTDGNPIPEVRTGEYVPGRVIARFAGGAVNLPRLALSGTARDIADPGLRRVAEGFGLSGVRRVYKRATKDDRHVLSRTGETVTLLNTWDVYLLQFPIESPIWTIVDSLRALPACVYAQPDLTLRLLATPNDTLYLRQQPSEEWHIDRIDALRAWDIQTGSPSVRIGVIDDGLTYGHPDLGGCVGPGCKVVGGYDFTDDDQDFSEECMDTSNAWDCISHGTWVAGAAAALTNNHIGVAGVAGGWGPNNTGCSLVGFRCAANDTSIDTAAAIAAIEVACWSEDWRCDVLNASWGGATYNDALREAILNAHRMGVVFVSGKGYLDGEGNHRFYPGDYDKDWVICVSGSNSFTDDDPIPERRVHVDDIPIPFGYTPGYGYGLDVLAPGLDIFTTSACTWCTPRRYRYFYPSGTSYSTPQVSGLAALLLSEDSTLCTDDVEGLICAGCKDILTDRDGGVGLLGYDEWSGWGRINAYNSLSFLRSPYQIDHYTAPGGYSVGNVLIFPMEFRGEGVPQGNWFTAFRYDVRCDVTYPQTYETFPHVWGRGLNATTGWSGSNVNYKVGYCEVVHGSETQTGCQLRSYVYHVYFGLLEVGWFPCTPEEVTFAYSVLGGTEECGSVPDQTIGKTAVQSLEVLPNPAAAETRLRVCLSTGGELILSVYDVQGRKVRRIFGGKLARGTHDMVWDGTDDRGRRLPAGVYFFKAEAGISCRISKVILLR
jgi:hypothetical protein